ncbi:MAG: ABC transporter permease [Saprospiraceae bacterium]|jgi:peptide/nickel transport system permease protein|nr:ABC transporter permease [Saprospiraceae bacterium]
MMINRGILYRLSIFIIFFYIAVAFLAPFIAGDTPIICLNNGVISLPIINSGIRNEISEGSKCLMPLIPFSTQNIDPKYKTGISPFDKRQSGVFKSRHWMGTDKLGRDVASAMVHGSAIALKIGFLSVFFSFIIGVSLGMAAGYYQDNSIKMSWIQLSADFLFFITGVYYMWMEFIVFNDSFYLFLLGSIFVMICLIILHKLTGKFVTLYQFYVPVDIVIVKIIEIRKSFPGIFLLLALISIFRVPSVWNIVIIITILSWADFARLTRGDTLSIKNENYIISAQVLGFSDIRIMWRHILPNILPTLIVAVCFSIGGAVILESTLSFLGIGLPVEEVSWGKLMAEGRNMRYWWLVFFPGLAIFVLVLSLNSIASAWQKSNFNMFS